MLERKYRIENEIPNIDLDFDAIYQKTINHINRRADKV